MEELGVIKSIRLSVEGCDKIYEFSGEPGQLK